MARILFVFAVICVATTFAEEHPAWMENLFNKENENRGKHGANPLSMNEDLNKAAQEWADKQANDCVKGTHAPDELIQYQGQQMGENLNGGQMKGHPEAVQAYALDHASEAADAWYKEIKDYPWPEYTGQDGPMVFHFTQQVWKGTEQVGYGLGLKDGCDRWFVVARYWPTGNVETFFGANVLPPQ